MFSPALSALAALPHLIVSQTTDGAPEYEGLIGWVLNLMDTLGEVGVGLAVLIETFVPPIPSEAVLPGAGFLAYDGRMNFWLAWLMATLGALVGAWIWYAIGYAFGRDRTRWVVGKVPLMEHEDFDKAEAFFTRFGGAAVLFGRCVPLVRSFISIPAGIERMNFLKFTVYTLIGSGVWNGIWIGLGWVFGPAIRPILEQWSGVLSDAIVVIVLLLLFWFVIARVIRLVRRRREAATAAADAHETAAPDNAVNNSDVSGTAETQHPRGDA